MLSQHEWLVLLSVSPALYGCAFFFWLGDGRTPGLVRLKALTMGILISLFLILPFSLLPIMQSHPVTVVLCGFLHYLVTSTVFGSPLSARWLCQRIALYDFIFSSPMLVDHLGLLRVIGLQWIIASDLTEVSKESLEEHKLSLENGLQKLRTYRSWQDHEDSRFFEHMLRCIVQVLRSGGVHSLVPGPNMLMAYPICTAGGLQDTTISWLLSQKLNPNAPKQLAGYITRLRKLAKFYADLEGLLLADGGSCLRAPSCVLQRALRSASRFRATPSAKHPLVLQIPAVCAEQRQAAAAVVEKEVFPAHRRFEACLQKAAASAEELEASEIPRALPGLSYNPSVPAGQGRRMYEAFLELHAMAEDCSPASLHLRGLEEVARLQGRILGLVCAEQAPRAGAPRSLDFTALGAPSAINIPEVQRFLQGEQDTRDKAAVLEDYRALLRTIHGKLERLFWPQDIPATLPRVVSVPPSLEDSSPAASYMPGGAGTFSVNHGRGRRVWRGAMASLALHEGVPGHHLQFTVAQKQRRLPMYRQHCPWFTAHMEGWALYAEELGVELGLYDNAPEKEACWRLLELWRAARLVADTGLHAVRWPRAAAVEFLCNHALLPREQAEAEVDRMLSMPAQAVGYCVGKWEIQRLRAESAAALGAAFDLRAFHHALLKEGTLPIHMLRQQVAEYVREARNSGRAQQPSARAQAGARQGKADARAASSMPEPLKMGKAE